MKEPGALRRRDGRRPHLRIRVAWITGLVAVLVAGIAVPAGSSELPNGFERVEASDGRAEDWFGYSLAIDGDRVVVGAPFDHIDGRWLGTVWVFTRWGLGWHSEMIKPDQLWRKSGGVHGGRRFGYSVDIASDRIVVGAPNAWINGVETGGVFVFDYLDGEWVETILEPDGIESADGIGWRVEISEDGNRILAGSMKSAPGSHRPGKAFLYDYVGGEWVSRMFQSSDGRIYDQFGAGIGLGDGFFAVGAPDHRGGAIYIYEEDGADWTETKIVPEEPAGDRFGQSVGVFGAVIAVFTDERGEMFLVEKGPDGWAMTPRHLGDDFEAGGTTEAAPEDAQVRDLLYQSDFGDERADRAPGAVIRFWWDGDAWVELLRYEGSDYGEGAGFGFSLAGQSETLVVGAPWHDPGGAAYIRDMPFGCGGWEPTILGTNGDDEIFGTPGNDVILPGVGADTIHSSGGRDVYCLEADGDYTFVGPVGGVRDGHPGREALITIGFTARWWGVAPE